MEKDSKREMHIAEFAMRSCIAAHNPRYRTAYDEDADVLYVSVGKPRPATSDELPAGILYRRDPRSNEFVGMTIIGFLKYFLPSEEWNSLREMFPDDLVKLIDDLRVHPDELFISRTGKRNGSLQLHNMGVRK